MPGPHHFDAMAATYDRGRPPYPQQVWDLLASRGLLRPGTRALDLGAGSGLATGPLLAAGATVTAVEPGPALAAILVERHPAVDLRVTTAEQVELADAGYDLAVAATAIHWFDLDVVLPKVRRALTADGRFVVWRNSFGDRSVAVTPFRERVQQIVAARTPRADRPPTASETPADWTEPLTATGDFAVEDTVDLGWSITLDARQIGDLFATFSDWTADEARAAAQATEDLGGSVVEHYRTPLVILRPVR